MDTKHLYDVNAQYAQYYENPIAGRALCGATSWSTSNPKAAEHTICMFCQAKAESLFEVVTKFARQQQ